MTPALAFPLCREPAHEAAMREVLERCVSFLSHRLPRGSFVALILTGSFSRGEGTVLPVGDRLRVLGDIEFLVVLPTRRDARVIRPQMATWSREASATVGGRDASVDVEFGPVEVDYLRKRAKPSIFVHDLRHHGKVLWGRPDILTEIPDFDATAIPRDDALFLIFNRMIEQLEAYDALATRDGEALLQAAYQRLKLVLDLAGSALAFTGRHSASYVQRPGAFAGLVAETPTLAGLLPADFEAELKRAAHDKLVPTESALLPAASGGIAAQRRWLGHRIVGGVPAVAAFLQWELEQRLGVRGELSALVERFLATPSLVRRVRGWLKLGLHPMPAPVPLSPVRSARLFWRSSPRVLLYACAMLAYLALERPGDGRSARIDRLLPAARAAGTDDVAAQRRAIVALWRWCVRND